MHFAFTEDQQFLQETARDVAGNAFGDSTVRAALADDDGKVRTDAWAAVVDLGWAGVLVPESDGGSGGSVVDACILAEVLAAVLAPVPFVGTAIGAAAVLGALGDTAAQGELVDGRPFSLALDARLRWPSAEPVLAWDWLPGGEVIQVGTGGTTVRTAVVPLGFDALDPLHPLAVVDGLRGDALQLDEALRRALAVTRVGVAAAAAGLAAAALEEAVAYAKQREQYGRPIAEFQAVQHLCADMLVDVESTRSMAYGAAWVVEHERIEEAERVAAAASGWCGPAAVRVVETGIQVLGGIGVTWEHDAHLRLRHAQLLNRALGGAQQAMESLAVFALAGEEE